MQTLLRPGGGVYRQVILVGRSRCISLKWPLIDIQQEESAVNLPNTPNLRVSYANLHTYCLKLIAEMGRFAWHI